LPQTPKSLTLVAKAESLGSVTEFVRTGAQEADLPELQMRQLELLIEEIFVNISRYSYPENAPGSVTVTYAVPKPGELSIEVVDQGIEFDPLAAPAPNLTLDLEQRPIGGLGIFLLKTFAGSLSYRREEGWNRLKFGISANS
jgi:anti-sigma regulatory factor (Ser/Thr protein kinase)